MVLNKKIVSAAAFAIFVCVSAAAQSESPQDHASVIKMNPELAVNQEDLLLVPDYAEDKTVRGVNLFIRKKENIQSVMLVETTKDPEGKSDNYAFRALEFNEINGNEIRLLDGKVLKSEYSKYTLISSTPVTNSKLGECFQIYIPKTMVYGYPWGRNGTVSIGRGTFINIRSFSKKYGDYTGNFQDNPFMFDFVDPVVEEKVIITDEYNPEAAETFLQIATFGKGRLTYSKGPDSITKDLIRSLDEIKSAPVADVVFAVDTTGSMNDDMDVLKKEWIPELIKQFAEFKDLQVGLLFYRDYNDDYHFKGLPVKPFAFTKDLTLFTKNLNSVRIRGMEGGDKPEAVYEALYASMTYFEWREDSVKKVILVGDAEPHSKPRGSKRISQEMVAALSEEKNITLDCIILPDSK